MTQPPLTSPFTIATVELPNRVAARAARRDRQLVRAPAGAAPRRRARGLGDGLELRDRAPQPSARSRSCCGCTPTRARSSIQLFGSDPDVMREAAAVAAQAGPDLIDLNMGCPVPKVLKTGAGAALIRDPTQAVAVARAAREGSGLPVTVKVRSGIEPGDHSGVDLAERLVVDAGVAAIALHPRPAKQFHRGRPEYELVGELRGRLERGGTGSGDRLRRPARRRARPRRLRTSPGADAVMIARGSLGNPWIFERADRRARPGRRRARRSRPSCSGSSIGRPSTGVRARAARNLRKFYPWYVERLGVRGPRGRRFQRTDEPRSRSASCSRRGRPQARLQRPRATKSHRYNPRRRPARSRRNATRFGHFYAGKPRYQAV